MGRSQQRTIGLEGRLGWLMSRLCTAVLNAGNEQLWGGGEGGLTHNREGSAEVLKQETDTAHTERHREAT